VQLHISVRLIPNKNHLPSHEKMLLEKEKRKKIQKYGKLDQNPYVSKNDT